MGRLRSKKFSAHAAAARAGGAKGKATQSAASSASGHATAAAEAAVKAAFGGDEDEPLDAEELVPIDNEDSGDEGDAAMSGLSRGQRKRMKRRSAFMRKMGLVQRVVQEKETAKKKAEQGAFAEIKELQDALFLSDKELAQMAASKVSQSTNVAAKAGTDQKPKKLSGKQRQKLAVRELGQLKAVHTHPQFQNDPFAAIQMHLQNTVVQANQATIQKQAAKPKGKSKNAMDVE